jgi:hypothetical protein
MDCRELNPPGVLRLGLEAIDHVWFFERVKRQLAQVLLEDVDATAHRAHAFQRRRFHAPFDVRVQETCDVLRCGVR